MPKPNRRTEDAFFDVFTDMPVVDQATALKICEQIHRQAKRDIARVKEVAAVPLLTDAEANGGGK